MVLAALVGAGLVINRNEHADSEEAPEVEHKSRQPRKDGAMPLPYRPPKTKKSPTWDDLRAQREQKLAPRNAEALDHRGEPMAAPAGPFGDGPMAHFTESQVGTISQAPAQLSRAGAGIDPARQAAKREIATPGPPEANRLVVPPTAGIDAERKRYTVPYSKNSIAPFEAERERPLGETSSRLRNAAEPRDVDALRSASNPKDTKGGRFVAAPFGHNVPGKPGAFTKQRRFGEGSRVPGDDNGHFGTGAAAVRRGAIDGDFFVPKTQRAAGYEGQMGPAARALGSSTSCEVGETRNTSPNITSIGHTGFLAGGPRDRDRSADVSMYGDDIGVPGRGSGAPRMGAAHASPMGTRAPLRMPEQTDVGFSEQSDATRKSLLTPAPRQFGGLQIANNPPKQTIYEPEPLRTTMRETSIHDTHEGMIRGMSTPGETRSPDAQARATVRETIGEVQGSRGDGRLDGTVMLSKAPVYDPYDVFDTTTKETTEANAHMGNVGACQGSQGPGAQPQTQATQRAFDADSSRAHYFGNASREQADAYRAHTAKGSSIVWSKPDTTNRDVNGCTDYKGSASASIKAFPRDDQAYTRAIGDVKERILKQRTPNGRKQLISPSAHDVGVRTWQRDPCTDTTASRLVFENQHQWQQKVQPDTCEDTRGGRQVQDQMPDTSVLSQLRNNPYAVKNKGVVMN